MPLETRHFEQAAAQGGIIRPEAGDPNQLRASSNSLLKRLRGPSSQEKAENQALRASLAEALKQSYGNEFAASAAGQLDVNSTSPLTARSVQTLIQAGKDHVEAGLKSNRALADKMSGSVDANDPSSFASIYARKAQQMGFNHALGDLNVARLQHAIGHKIGSEGNGGKVRVSEADALKFAEREIEKYITKKLELENKISSMGVSGAEQQTLTQFAMTHDVSTPVALEQTWQLRTHAQDMVKVMADPNTTRADRIKAASDYQKAYDVALLKVADGVNPEDFGADDVLNLNSDAIEMGMKTGFNSQESKQIYDQMSTPAMAEVRSAALYANMNSDENGIGAETNNRLRNLNETLGLVVKNAGQAGGVAKDDLQATEEIQDYLESVDSIPPDILQGFNDVGMQDIHYSLGKQMEMMADSPAKDLLVNASVNMQVTRDIAAQRPDSHEGDVTKLNQTLAQTEVLLQLRENVSKLPDSGARSLTMKDLDTQISTLLKKSPELVKNAGLDNDATMAALSQVKELAGSYAAQGLPPAQTQALEMQQITLQSEILVRQSEPYQKLQVGPQHPEYEMNMMASESMIQGRVGTGQVIYEDLSVAMERPVSEEMSAQMDQRTQAVYEQMSRADEMLDGPDAQAAREELDRIRMGGSDTLKGKSGGGELEGGADLAARNWKAGSDYVADIAKSGQMITGAQIQELNKILNKDLPANDGVPGEFRQRPETSGGRSQYPTPEYIPKMMKEFDSFLAQNQDKNPIELAALSYQKVLSIHPFDDGNGRTARLVADGILQSKGLPPAAVDATGDDMAPVFGVPQKGKENPTPDQVIAQYAAGVERSVQLLSKQGLQVDQSQNVQQDVVVAPSGPSLEKSALHHTPQQLMADLDTQTAQLQRIQERDLARLETLAPGAGKDALQDIINTRAANIADNNQFKERLNQGEHPTLVELDMAKKGAVMLQNDDREKLEKAAKLLTPQDELAVDDIQADELDADEMNPDDLQVDELDVDDVKVDSPAPQLSRPPPTTLPPLPGEAGKLSKPPPTTLPPLPGEEAQARPALQRTPSVRDIMQPKGPVSGNPFKIQDDLRRAELKAAEAATKPEAPKVDATDGGPGEIAPAKEAKKTKVGEDTKLTASSDKTIPVAQQSSGKKIGG